MRGGPRALTGGKASHSFKVINCSRRDLVGPYCPRTAMLPRPWRLWSGQRGLKQQKCNITLPLYENQ